MAKDYYKILDIEKGASKDEIKKAFRKKAHQYHPDKEGGDEAKFKEINEAYQVLSDDQKRSQYDQFGQTFDGAGGFGGAGGFQGMNFEDLGDIFGDFFGGGFGGGRGRVQKGQDIQIDMTLDFKDAIFGIEKEVSVSKNNTCERCAGNGGEPGTTMHTCKTCDGTGMTVNVRQTMLGAIQQRQVCVECHGNGEKPEDACTNCDGIGIEYGRKTIRVDVPPGVENGMRIRLRGQGEALSGGQPGDLYIMLHVKNDSRFERVNDRLITTKEIGFTQAALGDEVQVETLDGDVKMKIPAGTQSGEKLRLRGKGVPHGRGRGDMIVVIQVKTPTKLGRKERKILEELDLRA